MSFVNLLCFKCSLVINLGSARPLATLKKSSQTALNRWWAIQTHKKNTRWDIQTLLSHWMKMQLLCSRNWRRKHIAKIPHCALLTDNWRFWFSPRSYSTLSLSSLWLGRFFFIINDHFSSTGLENSPQNDTFPVFQIFFYYFE